MNEADVGRREAGRYSVDLAAELSVEGYGICVALRDLSQTGACLVGPAPLRPGLAVYLKCSLFASSGVVVWSAPPRCGIAFVGRLPGRVVQAARRAAAPFPQGAANRPAPGAESAPKG